MILIDALNINGSGSFILLKYLLLNLEKSNIRYFVLLDSRNEENIEHCHKFLIKSNILYREMILYKYIKKKNPYKLLCFGNYPPLFKKKIPVITMFHNPNLLVNMETLRIKKISWFFKRQFLNICKKNSNSFIVQNDYIKQFLSSKYSIAQNAIEDCCFYDESGHGIEPEYSKISDKFVYISYPHKHKNHSRLLKAWEILLTDNITPTLIVTIPCENTSLIKQINEINNHGGQIINKGNLTYKDALLETKSAKYCIFPSNLETLGLGLIEAFFMKCIVLSSNNLFIRAVMNSDFSFDEQNPLDIANVVKKALSSDIKESAAELLVANRINTYISLLKK